MFVMDSFSVVFTELFNVWKDMMSAFFGILPKIISVFLWVLVAIIVLPCVFIAGHIYPKWVDWGEGF